MITYNIVVVSVIQHELAISIHMSPPSWTSSHFLPHLTPLGCHRALDLGSLQHTANSYWLSILHLVMYMFQCSSLKSSHILLPLLCPKFCSLCLSLLFCHASRIISTTFVYSLVYMYMYMYIYVYICICFSIYLSFSF